MRNYGVHLLLSTLALTCPRHSQKFSSSSRWTKRLQRGTENQKRLLFTNWSPYRVEEKWKFSPQKINPYLCTHVIYAFAKVLVDEADVAPGDSWQDINLNGFKDFIDLREKFNENLKCLLAVGGYRAGSDQFSPISASPEKRKTLARNSLKFLQTYGFDGFNIDWQFPNDQGRKGKPEDFDNFVLLLKDIDEVFREEATSTGEQKKMLTISVPGNILTIQAGYDLTNIQKYVEFMNILAYDYHLPYDPDTGHHSPLYPLPEEMAGSHHPNEGLNTDSTINYILMKNVDPYKLNLGIPLFGRSFTLEEEDDNGLGSPAIGQGEQGKFTREDGFKAYYEICSNITDGWTIVQHNKTAMGPYTYKQNQWVGYDDEESARRKGKYAKEKGLGGLSFWSIDQDDFLAVCGSKAYPLIKAARESYIKAKGPTTESPVTSVSTSKTADDLEVTPPSTTAGQRKKPPMRLAPDPNTANTNKVVPELPSLLNGYQTVYYAPVIYVPVAYFPVVYCFFQNPIDTTMMERDVVVEVEVPKDETHIVHIPSTISKNVPSPAGGNGNENGSMGFGNLILNIYNWGTNYIFSHSPPQNIVGAAQMHKKPVENEQLQSADESQAKWSGEVDISTILNRRVDQGYKKGSPVWN